MKRTILLIGLSLLAVGSTGAVVYRMNQPLPIVAPIEQPKTKKQAELPKPIKTTNAEPLKTAEPIPRPPAPKPVKLSTKAAVEKAVRDHAIAMKWAEKSAWATPEIEAHCMDLWIVHELGGYEDEKAVWSLVNDLYLIGIKIKVEDGYKIKRTYFYGGGTCNQYPYYT